MQMSSNKELSSLTLDSAYEKFDVWNRPCRNICQYSSNKKACLCAGPVFGSKNFFSGVGIFFDTYSNENGEHAVSSRPVVTPGTLRQGS